MQRLPACVGVPGRERLLSYRSSIQATTRYHEGQYVRDLKRYAVQPREEYIGTTAATGQDAGDSEDLEGVRRLRRFEDLLENGYEYRRSHFQKGFHSYCTAAVAPNLVGPADWERAGPQVIKQKSWNPADLGKMKLASAPRRFGKSIAVGRFATTFGICKPGSIQAIFSTGRRASKNLLDIMFKCLNEAGFGHTITRFNQEELFFCPDGPLGGESRIFSFPAKAKIDTRGSTRRGYTGGFILSLSTL